MKHEKTQRGFVRIEFEDFNGEMCSLLKSSIATDDCIWLGVNDAKPRVCVLNEGWKPYLMPDDVMMTTRMHLSRDQVAALMPYFVYFVENGDLPEIPEREEDPDG